jgi:hypothetical protein
MNVASHLDRASKLNIAAVCVSLAFICAIVVGVFCFLPGGGILLNPDDAVGHVRQRFS